MANTIFDGSTTITPSLISGWESNQESQTVVHKVIGKSAPDVTLKPAGMRTGTLETVFLTASSANIARTFLSQAKKFILATDQTWLVEMHFVVTGNVTCTLEPSTQNVWLVKFDFQEVSP